MTSRRKSAHVILAAIIGVISLNFINLPFYIRFNYAPLNYWACLFLSIALPFSILNFGVSLNNRKLKIVSICSAILVALPCVVAAIFIAIMAVDVQRTGNDPSLELLQQVSVGVSKYRLYRTDCGATCSFGLELRKEIDAPFGLKLVRSLLSKYREDEGKLVLVPGKEVQVFGESGFVGSVPL
jgi:hypothetical protein